MSPNMDCLARSRFEKKRVKYVVKVALDHSRTNSAQYVRQHHILARSGPEVLRWNRADRHRAAYAGRFARQMPGWSVRSTGAKALSLLVVGWPGESRRAVIGISLTGAGERPVAPCSATARRR